MTQVEAALARLPRHAANHPRKMLHKAQEIMSTIPAGARRVLVLYTDGNVMACFPCPQMSDEEIASESAKVRAQGVDIFAVGIPGRPSGRLSAVITGDPNRVYQPADVSDLAAKFRGVAMAALDAPRGGAVVSQALDGRHWQVPSGQPGWQPFSSGVLYQQISWLPPQPIKRELSVVPGQWAFGGWGWPPPK